MGLDTTEIVLELEKRLDVRFSDNDLAEIYTIGQLEDYLCSVVSPDRASGTVCMTARAFYRTRRALAQVTGIHHKTIRPTDRLTRLIPWYTRRRRWSQLTNNLNLRIPSLRPYDSLLPALGLTLSVTVTVLVGIETGLSIGLLTYILSLATSFIALPWFLPRQLPVTTVGGLTQQVLAMNYERICQSPAEKGAYHELRDAIHVVVTDVFVSVLGVKPEQITREARIVDDLGAG